jgi:hypothetical protein
LKGHHKKEVADWNFKQDEMYKFWEKESLFMREQLEALKLEKS